MRTFSIWQWGRALSCAVALLGCGDDAEGTSPNEDGGLDLGPDSGGDGDGDEVLACPEMLGAGATTEVSNEYAIGIGPFFMLAAGDVDGDGVGEVVIDRDTLLSQGDFSYMEGDAEIECGDASACRVDAKFLVTADLNGDDETDWLIANSVFINDGAGKLVWASEVAGDYWMDTVVGDIDGDQNADVITLHSDTEECGLARFDREAAGEAASCDVVMAIHEGIHLCPEGERCFQGEDDGDMGFCHPPRCAYGVIHLGAGDGTFTESGRFDVDRPWWNENVGNLARLVDLDGDGHLDLVSRTPFSQEEGSTVLQRGVGDGTFEEVTVLQERGPSPRQDLFIADVDGDDDIDLISGNQVLFNDGHGAFPNDVTLTTYLDSLTDGVHPGDVDGDGRVELVVVDFNDDATTLISVLQVEESGVTPLHRFCDERRGNLSDVADLDGDGKAELLVGYQFSGLTVYGF